VIKLISILKEFFLIENFYSIKDTKYENPLTQYILDQLKGKIPGLKNSKDPKLEASGAEGIVISLDDYKVIKLFFSLDNAEKSVPFLNKKIDFSAKIISVGTIKLDEKVAYLKKGSTYSKSDLKQTDTLYYVVMERVIPDEKTYNDVENKYINFASLKDVKSIDRFSEYLKFTKNNSLEDFSKNQILKPFLLDNNITYITVDQLYDSEFNINNLIKKISKSEANNLINVFLQWKKKQTKTYLYVFGEKNTPLLFKWAMLCYLGKYNLDYDIKKIISNFYSLLKQDNQNQFNEILSLLKDIIITNKIDWKDIHKGQFGRLKSSNKLVAIDIGVKKENQKFASSFNKNLHRVNIKLKSRQSITEKKEEVEELNFFDFDGTLFLTPDKDEGSKMYKKITGKDYPHEGWAGKPESLLPEYNIELNPIIIPHLKKALNNPKAKNFLLTNRNYKLEKEVKKILHINNIYMDEYLFKVGSQSKTERIENTFEKYPEAKKINVFDDKISELSDININFKDKYELWRPELIINLKQIIFK